MQVEAKRAVPKDEQALQQDGQQQQGQGAMSGGGGGTGASSSDGSAKSRKIFVGGLAPSVDEAALRQYFEGFGPVEDAVVMYDHDNRRPRGFGFVTFTAEESVEMVFAKGSMQSIADKQIEIKSAVPRDQMPPSTRGPPNGYYDPRYAGGMGGPPGGRNGYGPYGPPPPGQFAGLPPRGGYGGPRNYVPTAHGGRGGPRYSEGMGPSGYPGAGYPQQPGRGSGAMGGGGMPGMGGAGKMPGMPGGPDAYDMYGVPPQGMYSQAALAYNIASLQQQAQAHLNGIQAAAAGGGLPAGGGAVPKPYGPASELNLNALSALAAGAGYGTGAALHRRDATAGMTEAELYADAAAIAASIAAADSTPYNPNFFNDIGQHAAQPTAGWTS